MITSHYLFGKKVERPANADEIAIELNFDKDIPTETVTINKWRWTGDNVDLIMKHYRDGIAGGVGVTEGIPHKVTLEKSGIKSTLADAYIDLLEDVDFSCNEITTTSKEKLGIDSINDRGDGFTFEYLDSIGQVPADKIVWVPYIINAIPNTREIIITSLTVFVISQEMKREVAYYQEQIPKFSNPFTATELISTALHIVYTISLIVTLVKMIKDLINYIIQPVKYHAGMYVKDLFAIGAGRLGYSFNSTIFKSEPWSKLVIIPEKFEQFDNEGILGFTKKNIVQKGYYQGTFGDFVRAFKTLFAGKIIPTGKVFNFERIDFNLSKAKYIVPNLRNDFFKLNTDEFFANTLVEFQVDLNDKNTIKDYKGTSVMITTSPKKVINADLVLTKKLQRITIPFALAKRKMSLTVPEKIVKGFAIVVSVLLNGLIAVVNVIIVIYNEVVSLFEDILAALDFFGININVSFKPINKIQYVDFGAAIDDRIGMMLLENDFIAIPKLVIINENKANNRKTDIHEDNATILNAKNIYEQFQFVNNFVGINGKHNQWIKYKLDRVPFTFDDYQKVKTDNIITDNFNNFARIDSCKYFPEQGYASINYRVNKLYTNNLKNEITENTGR